MPSSQTPDLHGECLLAVHLHISIIVMQAFRKVQCLRGASCCLYTYAHICYIPSCRYTLCNICVTNSHASDLHQAVGSLSKLLKARQQTASFICNRWSMAAAMNSVYLGCSLRQFESSLPKFLGPQLWLVGEGSHYQNKQTFICRSPIETHRKRELLV